MSLSKQVVRFSLQMEFDKASGLSVDDGAVVRIEWKRGKHHGSSGGAPVKGGVVQWDGREESIPCTMYYNGRKEAWEEKTLSVNVMEGASSGRSRAPLARGDIHLQQLAGRLQESAVREGRWPVAATLEGNVVLHVMIALKALATLPPPCTSSSKSAAVPAPRSNRRPPPGGETSATSSSPRSLAESPLQTLGTSKLAKEDSTRSKGGARRPVPPLDTTTMSNVPSSSSSEKQDTSSKPSSPVRTDEEGPSSPVPMPIPVRRNSSVIHRTSSSSSHSRAGSLSRTHTRSASRGGGTSSDDGGGASSAGAMGPPLALVRSSEVDVSGAAMQTQRTQERKKHFMHGHRRGKSHAVTPDELRGLDLRATAPISASSASVAQLPSARKSGHSGSKLAFKSFKNPTRSSGSSSVSAAYSPALASALSPRGAPPPLSAGGTVGSLGAEAFLIDASDSSDSEVSDPLMASLPTSSSSAVASSQRHVQRAASPVTSHSPKDAEVEFLKRQLAEQNRQRDQQLILSQYVTYAEAVYSEDGVPHSAYVLFRCLVQWDGLGSSDGREFREALLEAFEQVCKASLDLSLLLYRLSSFVAFLSLLHHHLPPIPRADVARATALAVFQERLRGLASSMASRAALVVVGELRPVLAASLLEHGGLDDMGGADEQMRPLMKVLHHLDDAMKAAHLSGAPRAHLLSKVAHGTAALAINTMLERPGLCTFSNGLQMKGPLQTLKAWFSRDREEEAATLLAPLEEVATVLCMNKGALVEADVRRDVCPHVSDAQLGQLLLLYTPDAFDSEAIHPRVLAQLCPDDLRPDDYQMDPELRLPLKLDPSDVDYKVHNVHLPKTLTNQPSFTFLASSHRGDDDSDAAW